MITMEVAISQLPGTVRTGISFRDQNARQLTGAGYLVTPLAVVFVSIPH